MTDTQVASPMPDTQVANPTPDTQVAGATPETQVAVAGPAAADTDLKERVEKVLDTIRPAIAMDGGAVELLDVRDGVVTVRHLGACGGCPMSSMTLKRGIEQRIKAAIPEITRVDAI